MKRRALWQRADQLQNPPANIRLPCFGLRSSVQARHTCGAQSRVLCRDAIEILVQPQPSCVGRVGGANLCRALRRNSSLCAGIAGP